MGSDVTLHRLFFWTGPNFETDWQGKLPESYITRNYKLFPLFHTPSVYCGFLSSPSCASSSATVSPPDSYQPAADADEARRRVKHPDLSGRSGLSNITDVPASIRPRRPGTGRRVRVKASLLASQLAAKAGPVIGYGRGPAPHTPCLPRLLSPRGLT